MIWFFVSFIIVMGIVLFVITSSKEGEGGSRDKSPSRRGSSNDLSVKDKLILGAGAAKLIEKEEELYQQRKREREQKRLDDLNWQDAARRKDSFGDDDSSEAW